MDINEIASQYEASTQFVKQIIGALSGADLDRHQVDGWTPRQVIHHLADSEAQSYARLRRLIAEPTGTIIQGYDEAAWAESKILGYRELPVEPSIAVLYAVRASSLGIIRRLSESDLTKTGEHTEYGAFTIARWIEVYTRHPRDHGNQITEALT